MHDLDAILVICFIHAYVCACLYACVYRRTLVVTGWRDKTQLKHVEAVFKTVKEDIEDIIFPVANRSALTAFVIFKTHKVRVCVKDSLVNV